MLVERHDRIAGVGERPEQMIATDPAHENVTVPDESDRAQGLIDSDEIEQVGIAALDDRVRVPGVGAHRHRSMPGSCRVDHVVEGLRNAGE
ncbi:hypothetical protein [Microbacterium schleiferi]|uniref:hypothetical protein n=1 Tax=Microbacterium schleiferi TaxID=69362 RepID=UPI001E430402|nr:hypothetical protein [Microbacterium schleiferi]